MYGIFADANVSTIRNQPPPSNSLEIQFVNRKASFFRFRCPSYSPSSQISVLFYESSSIFCLISEHLLKSGLERVFKIKIIRDAASISYHLKNNISIHTVKVLLLPGL